jgi:hypothetical protein
MISRILPDLWTLALDQPHIDPAELADALDREAARQPLDFRTRLLIRDSLTALKLAWGEARFTEWLSHSSCSQALAAIARDDLGRPGFPSLIHRTMEPTRTGAVLEFLRDLGQSVGAATSITIGGSVALILAGLLSRRTEDIDVVDELPLQLRGEHDLLENLARRYDLRLTHFQSHYLPAAWESRLTTLGTFGKLKVQLVSADDIFLSKLFSNREKDRDDLHAMFRRLDKSKLTQLLKESAVSLLGEGRLRQNAEKNWYVLFGEALPQ